MKDKWRTPQQRQDIERRKARARENRETKKREKLRMLEAKGKYREDKKGRKVFDLRTHNSITNLRRELGIPPGTDL